MRGWLSVVAGGLGGRVKVGKRTYNYIARSSRLRDMSRAILMRILRILEALIYLLKLGCCRTK